MGTFKRFGLTIGSTTAVMVTVLTMLGLLLDGSMSFESWYMLSVFCLGYVAVGSLLIGFPSLLLMRKRGWADGSAAYFCASGFAGAAASAAITFLLFLDGPFVAVNALPFLIPLGFFGGLTTAFFWQRLHLRAA